MAKIREAKSNSGIKLFHFMCPACGHAHSFNSNWTWNNDYDKPTLSPSVLVKGFGEDSKYFVCHSFIRSGNIQFLGDCTHKLAGKNVPLEDW